MKLAIIQFSGRSNSNSLKVANKLKSLSAEFFDAEVVDLASMDLPLNLDKFWMEEKYQKISGEIKSKMAEVDAAVFVIPEWSGGVPAPFALFRDLLGFELAYKPVYLVGVSATHNGGKYPLAEVRSTSSKNRRWIFAPEQLVIANVDSVFNDEVPKSEDDTFVTRKAKYGLAILAEMAEALKPMQSSKIIDHVANEHGM